MPSEMICDAHTCDGCRYLEQDGQDDQAAGFAEFLANCQHAKCKVVRLVRQQISKLQNVQPILITADMHKKVYKEGHDVMPIEVHEKGHSVMSIEVHEEKHDIIPSEVHEEEHTVVPTEVQKDGHDIILTEVYKAPYNEVHKVLNKMHKIPYSEIREVYGEVHNLYDGVYEVEGAIQRAQDEVHETQEPLAVVRRPIGVKNTIENLATTSLHHTAPPGRAVDRKWMLRILDRVCHRAHLILAAAAVGMIVWATLVYGVFLGATACGNGRICFTSSLKYTHTRPSLF